MNKTPLYQAHITLGGKMIEFAGWLLPVQYSSILEEHRNVREAAGLFDVSHMGQIEIKGNGAAQFLQTMITHDLNRIKDYQIIYSPMCYPHGGIVDDLLIYKYNEEHYLCIVNASNTEKDYLWFKEHCPANVTVCNMSNQYAQLSLQGPKAEQVLQKLLDIPLKDIKFFRFVEVEAMDKLGMIISRTGYTGEDGFEIYLSPSNAMKLWEQILEAGKEDGVLPVGLGARDTLRFEAGLPLYGHEISQDISPLEAGLDKFVKLDKGDFIGRQALMEQISMGIPRKLIGFEMIDRGIPRAMYEVKSGDKSIGYVTTGGVSPTLKKNIGMALVESSYSSEPNEIGIKVRNTILKAKVVGIPFYRKRYKVNK